MLMLIGSSFFATYPKIPHMVRSLFLMGGGPGGTIAAGELG
jgi:hypothetical protein